MLITALSVWEFAQLVNRREDVTINPVITTLGGVYLFIAIFSYCRCFHPSVKCTECLFNALRNQLLINTKIRKLILLPTKIYSVRFSVRKGAVMCRLGTM